MQQARSPICQKNLNGRKRIKYRNVRILYSERLKVVKENDISDVKRNPVGRKGERFEFAQMLDYGVNVEFAEGSLAKKQFQDIIRFIERVSK